ncbi:MAG: YdeI/OmpD-associated family protein [Actinomycetota bacterium]|nr:YdeI/OmpD-associated family protein [Actinomycetota bacterium]
MTAKTPAAAKMEPPTLAFETAAEFEAWVAEHRDDQVGLWLRIAKKGSGIPSVSYDEALKVALCYGWIDGQKGRGDDTTWRQRFCPRRPRSVWSKRNIGFVAELTEAGRMQPEGIAEVERAKTDGRWDKAYDGSAKATVPDDLRNALDAVPAAAAAFAGLTSTNRYAILYRVQDAKRDETRARRIAQFVEMLTEGRTPYPQGVMGRKG